VLPEDHEPLAIGSKVVVPQAVTEEAPVAA
jgi:hypothetical protein